jgi:hypothetical protein
LESILKITGEHIEDNRGLMLLGQLFQRSDRPLNQWAIASDVQITIPVRGAVTNLDICVEDVMD